MSFLTGDHPMVREAFDFMLRGTHGSVSVVQCEGERGMFLECWFLLETNAPARLHLDRFLAPTPIHFVLGTDGMICPDFEIPEFFDQDERGNLLQDHDMLQGLIGDLLDQAQAHAEALAKPLEQQAARDLQNAVKSELKRAEDLEKRGAHVPEAERLGFKELKEKGLAAIHDARLRLDAARFILRG